MADQPLVDTQVLLTLLGNQTYSLMHSLQELVDVVSKNKVKSIRTIEPRSDQAQDMLHDMYHRLSRQEFESDEEAATFYGYKNAQSRAYRKQRQKLSDRLYNSLVFIDTDRPDFSEAQKAFYQCHKELVAIRLLQGRGAKEAAMSVAKRTLSKAKKFELMKITVELLRLFKNYHSLHTIDLRAYKKISRELKRSEEVLRAENKAVDYYEDIHIEFKRHLILSEATRSKARSYIADLEISGKSIKTWVLHYMKFALINLIEMRENNFRGVINNAIWPFYISAGNRMSLLISSVRFTFIN